MTDGPANGGPRTPLWKRKRILIPLVLVLLVGVFIWWAGQPTQPAQATTPAADSTRLYQALADAGIPDAVADIDAERVFIRFNVPENTTRDEALLLVVLVAAQSDAPSKVLAVQVFESQKPQEELVWSMADVERLGDGNLGWDEFKNLAKRNELS